MSRSARFPCPRSHQDRAHPSIPSSGAEARKLADRHHAVATLWGTVISESDLRMVSFVVTPRDEQHGIRKFCAKYPDIWDFTEPFVAFVKTSVPDRRAVRKTLRIHTYNSNSKNCEGKTNVLHARSINCREASLPVSQSKA